MYNEKTLADDARSCVEARDNGEEWYWEMIDFMAGISGRKREVLDKNVIKLAKKRGGN